MPDIGINSGNWLVHLVVAEAEVTTYSCAGVELSQWLPVLSPIPVPVLLKADSASLFSSCHLTSLHAGVVTYCWALKDCPSISWVTFLKGEDKFTRANGLKIRHRGTKSQFDMLCMLPRILAHIHYMLKTTRPLGLVQKKFRETWASWESETTT